MKELIEYIDNNLTNFVCLSSCFGVYKFKRKNFLIIVTFPYWGNEYVFELKLQEFGNVTYQNKYENINDLIKDLNENLLTRGMLP